MAFGDGILECLGLKSELANCPYRVTLYGEDGATVEGVGRIMKISDDEIAFFARKKVVFLCGEKLKITRYGEKEASVSGKITSIRTEDVRGGRNEK